MSLRLIGPKRPKWWRCADVVMCADMQMWWCADVVMCRCGDLVMCWYADVVMFRVYFLNFAHVAVTDVHRSSAHLHRRRSSFAYVDYCQNGHLHIWTIVDNCGQLWTIVDNCGQLWTWTRTCILCNATHITLHRTRVLWNMGKVKKSTWYITAIVIPTVHRSSATWKQF